MGVSRVMPLSWCRSVMLVGLGLFAPLAARAQTGEISGLVADRLGSAVPAMTVELYQAWGATPLQTVVTDGSGSYGFTGLVDGSYWLRAAGDPARRLVPEYFNNVNDNDRGSATVLAITGGSVLTGKNFVLEPGATVSGSIVGLGAGESAVVTAYDADNGRFRKSATIVEPTSAFALANLPPGRYRIKIQPSDPAHAQEWYDGLAGQALQSAAAVVTVNASGDDVSLADVGLDPALSLSGSVTLSPDPGDGGSTMQNVRIEAQDPVTAEVVRSVWVTSTGTFTLGNLPERGYVLRANASSTVFASEYWAETGSVYLRSQAGTVATSRSDLVFDLGLTSAIGPITGRLVEKGTATGIAGMTVSLRDYANNSSRGSTTTDALGSFSITAPPGEYKLWFETADWNATNDRDFFAEYWNRCQSDPASCEGVISTTHQRVQHPQTLAGTSVGEFGLTEGGSITGTIYPVPGQALPSSFWVTAEGYTNGYSNGPYISGRITTNGDGTAGYRIRGLPLPAEYVVRANVGGTGTEVSPVYYSSTTRPSLPVTSSSLATRITLASVGEHASDKHIYLFEGGSISGAVTCLLEGVSVPAGGVSVHTTGMHWSWASTASDGTYALRGLPAGTYTVRVDGQRTGACGNVAGATRSSVAVTTGADTGGIDFVLQPGGSVQGTVQYRDANGVVHPAVGLWVYAYDYATGNWLSQVTTDTVGDYRLWGLPLGTPLRIKAQPQDLNEFFNLIPEYYDNTIHSADAQQVFAVADGEPPAANFLLELGGAISGRVTDESTSASIENVWVCPTEIARGQGFRCARTDASGLYVLRGLPPLSYHVSASLGDYFFEYYDGVDSSSLATPVVVRPSSAAEPVPVTPGIHFTLTKGLRMSGRVTANLGTTPVPGVTVRISGPTGRSTTTDSDGSFTFTALKPGTYQVSVTTIGSDYAPPAPRTITLSASVTNVDFDLAPGLTLHGAIFDETGATRLEGIRVLVSLRTGASWTTLSPPSPFVSNSNGEYLVKGLGPGSYMLQTNAEQGYVATYYRDVFRSSDATWIDVGPGVPDEPRDFHLVKGGEVRGQAYYDANGDGVRQGGEAAASGRRVRIQGTDGSFSYTTTTAADGSYLVTGVVRGTAAGPLSYRASLEANGSPYASEYYRNDGAGHAPGTFVRTNATTFTVPEAGVDGIDFSLVLGGGVRGSVTEAGTSTRLSGISVNVSSWDGNGFGFGTSTSSTGDYLVDGLPPGQYRVNTSNGQGFVNQYYNGKLLSADANPVTVSARTTPGDPLATPVDFALSRGATLTATVYYDANEDGADPGELLQGASLSVSQGVAPFNCCLGNSTGSGADGGARVTGLPLGTPLRVRVSATGLVGVYYVDGVEAGTTDPAAATVFTLGAGETRAIRVVLVAGGEITGFVRDGNGTGIGGLSVFARPASGSGTTANATSEAGDASVAGRYRLRGLVPGQDYLVNTNATALYPSEYYDDKPDTTLATAIRIPTAAPRVVTLAPIVLALKAQFVSGPSVTSIERGAPAATGVQLTAAQLAGPLCPSVPSCVRLAAGGGITLSNVSLSGGVFTFDVSAASTAMLGFHSLTIVNDFTLEDSLTLVPNAFEVKPEATPPPPAPGTARLYVANRFSTQIRVYAGTDQTPLGAIDVGGQSGGLLLSEDGSRAYLGTYSVLSIVDTRLGQELVRAETPGRNPGAGAVVGDALYIRDGYIPSDRIRVLDARTLKSLREIPIGSGAGVPRADPSRQWIYVPNRTDDSISVIRVSDDAVTRVPLPAGSLPSAVIFSPDGARAYVSSSLELYVIDTAKAWGTPDQALIDVDGDPANGIHGLPVRNSSNMASSPVAGGGAALYFYDSALRVVDLATHDLVKTIAVPGRVSASWIAASPDRVALGFTTSKDVYAVDTAGILDSSTPPVVSRFDQEGGFASPFYPGSGIFGPDPGSVPATAPEVSAVSIVGGTARFGAPFDVDLSGSRFDVSDPARLPVVWLQGTLVVGEVDAAQSTASSLRVRFPATTPSGSYRVAVTNVRGDVAAGVSPEDALSVLPGPAYAPTQALYATREFKGGLVVFEPSGLRATIATQPQSYGLALTPDGRRAFMQQFYTGAQPVPTILPDQRSDLTVVDLDPSQPTFRQLVRTNPYVLGGLYNDPAVTPVLDHPAGVFAYQTNGSDTVSIFDGTTGAELDVDGDPTTQTYPTSPGSIGTKLPGLTRLALDSTPTDSSLRPYTTAITPDGNLLYVAHSGRAATSDLPAVPAGLTIVDTQSRGVVGQIVGDVATVLAVEVAPDGSRVYLLGTDSAGHVKLLAYRAGVTDGSALLGVLDLPGSQPQWGSAISLAVSPDNNRVYVAIRATGNLEVFDVSSADPAAWAPLTTIPLGFGVVRTTVAADDRLLYVANPLGNCIHVVDIDPAHAGTYHKEIERIGDVAAPWGLAVQSNFTAPRIGAISPTSGPEAGGTPVVITGANFIQQGVTGPEVWFIDSLGQARLAASTWRNSFTIEAVTPEGATGPATVKVVNPGGLFGELVDRFHYTGDTTAPELTILPHAVTDASSATIVWSTSEFSSSRVEFGTATALGRVVQDAALVQDHSVVLTGLTPSTTYYFRVVSRDAAGNAGQWPVAPALSTFATRALPDTTAPVITIGPAVTVATDSAVVRWSTNEYATSVVRFAVAGGVLAPVSGVAGTTHSVVLTGLAPDTEYDYQVASADEAGNEVTTPVATFRTEVRSDTTPPAISNIALSYLGSNLVIVSWDTDEDSNSFVNYGVYQVYEQGIIDGTMARRHVMFLTNLRSDTDYIFQLGSTDLGGNTTIRGNGASPSPVGASVLSSDQRLGVTVLRAGSVLSLDSEPGSFRTAAQEDQVGPVVTLPLRITSLSGDKVLIELGTDEAASLLAQYGIGGLSESTFESTPSTVPRLVLAGLQPGQTYLLRLTLSDPKGNATVLDGLSFTTATAPDTTAPTIASVAVAQVTATGALVSWLTDEPADARVTYGPAGGPLAEKTGSDLARTHAVSLTGLRPGTAYAFDVSSRDAAGNLQTATGFSFTTSPVPPEIRSVVPDRLAQGSLASVLINGSGFEPEVALDFGPGVSVETQSVNPTRTQVSAAVRVDGSAPLGARSLSLRNPTSGLVAQAGLVIVDQTVPQLEISEPLDGAELVSRTVVVRGQVSEPAEVTVNGTPAAVTGSGPWTFQASLTLQEGSQSILVAARDASDNKSSRVLAVTVLLLRIDGVRVQEGNAGSTPALFTVTLSAPSANAVSVGYSTKDGTARAGSDYLAASGILTFPVGETVRSILVPVNGDVLDEPNEEFFVDLASPSGAGIAAGRGAATIEDDDEAPPIVPLSIDVKPGDRHNTIHPRSHGLILVAVLGSAALDVKDIDVHSIRFGVLGTEARPVAAWRTRVNRDRISDLMLLFRTRSTGIECGTDTVKLRARLRDGRAAEGENPIRTVGCGHGHGH